MNEELYLSFINGLNGLADYAERKKQWNLFNLLVKYLQYVKSVINLYGIDLAYRLYLALRLSRHHICLLQ